MIQDYNKENNRDSNNDSSDDIKEPASQNPNEVPGAHAPQKTDENAGDPNQKLTFADMSASGSISPTKDGNK